MFDIIPVTSDKPTDCGATCMKMLLTYYGDQETTLEDLIRECKTRLIGCTAADLMRVGNAHGLEVHAFKTDLDGMLSVDRPAIIWWKKCHWCVFCGIDDEGRIVICNPDRGRYRMSKSLFRSWYSGVALFNGIPEDIEGQEIIDVYDHIFMP